MKKLRIDLGWQESVRATAEGSKAHLMVGSPHRNNAIGLLSPADALELAHWLESFASSRVPNTQAVAPVTGRSSIETVLRAAGWTVGTVSLRNRQQALISIGEQMAFPFGMSLDTLIDSLNNLSVPSALIITEMGDDSYAKKLLGVLRDRATGEYSVPFAVIFTA